MKQRVESLKKENAQLNAQVNKQFDALRIFSTQTELRKMMLSGVQDNEPG
jgi:hypothetical protein